MVEGRTKRGVLLRCAVLALLVAVCDLWPPRIAVANSATVLMAPRIVPAGGLVSYRVDAGASSNVVCSLSAGSGDVRTSPRTFRVNDPIVAITWRTPVLARTAAWSVRIVCAPSVDLLSRRRPVVRRMIVLGGQRVGPTRLFGSSSIRVSDRARDDPSSGALEPRAGECAAPGNGYASRRDESSYCTGYDTWFVWRYRPEAALVGLGAAREWYAQAALPTGTTPIVGSVAWWQDFGAGGHVAVVTAVRPDAITVRESNVRGWNVRSTRTIARTSPDAPQGYIYGGDRLPSRLAKQFAAHRGYHGAGGAQEENTVAAYERAADISMDFAEVDVRRTSDGVMVLHHDPEIEGVRISRTKYGDLPRLPSGEPVNTLQDLVDAAAVSLASGKRTRLLVELKEAGYEAKVVAMLASRLSWDQFELMSFNPQSVKVLDALGNPARIGLLLNDAIASDVGSAIVAQVQSTGADFVAFDFGRATSQRLDALFAAGVRVTLWTVGDERNLRWFLGDPRVERIITSIPEVAASLRA